MIFEDCQLETDFFLELSWYQQLKFASG